MACTQRELAYAIVRFERKTLFTLIDRVRSQANADGGEGSTQT